MGSPGGVPVHRNARVLSNGALAMLIFSFAEVMLFAGLVSAFTIARANALVWPPPGQPRLPVFETAPMKRGKVSMGRKLLLPIRPQRHHPVMTGSPA